MDQLLNVIARIITALKTAYNKAKSFLMQFLGFRMKKPLIIVGPSGVGKNTLIKYLFSIYPNDFKFSVSTTTRKPRPNEQNGVDYHFVDRETFQSKVVRGDFYEVTEFNGNLYGTTKQAVSDIIKSGKIFITDIHVTAAIKLRDSGLDFNCLCILPESLQQLESRLMSRQFNRKEEITERLVSGQQEIHIMEQNPDIFIEKIQNNELNQAYKDLLQKVQAFYPFLVI